jgi:hypothetical protein
MRTTALFVLVNAYRKGSVCTRMFVRYLHALNNEGIDGEEWVLGSLIKDY